LSEREEESGAHRDYGESMRIAHVSVKNLLHTFNYAIPFNLNEHITIVHGMNGFGKTSLLRLINGLFNYRLYDIKEVPFTEMKIDFDDGGSLVITRQVSIATEQPRKRQKKHLRLEYTHLGSKPEVHEPNFETDSRVLGFSLAVLNNIPGLSRETPDMWRYHPTNELLGLDDILERFPHMFPRAVQSHRTLPEPFAKLFGSIDVRFIETQRLMAYKFTHQGRMDYEASQGGELSPAIMLYSKDLVTRMERTLGHFGALAESLDRTFPMRLVKQQMRSHLPSDSLRERLAALNQKRALLASAGLLDKEQQESFDPEMIDDSNMGVLSVYVEDTEKKLGVLEELAARINLFRRIVNDHFLFKQMQVNKQHGFAFVSTRTREELSLTHLSSGEQHELVLLYELLFKLHDNSLVLIDEPEISLHIAWQEEFLKDLKTIIGLSPFDVLVATHSPQIISDRWDLTVELEVPEEKR
jgi:ABC-type transport system involved in cytochrome c biogenesis ATPase subunit